MIKTFYDIGFILILVSAQFIAIIKIIIELPYNSSETDGFLTRFTKLELFPKLTPG